MSKKRLLSLIIAVAMVLALAVPAGAVEAEETETEETQIVSSGTCDENVTWTLDSKGLLTITGSGIVGNSAFEGNTDIINVVIGDGITRIGNWAFNGCSNLTTVEIPDSVETINNLAFAECSSLVSVNIPAAVGIIGSSVFYKCNSLTGIWVEEGNENYCSDERGVLFDSTMIRLIAAPGAIEGRYEIPDTVTSLDLYAFFECRNLTEVTVPASVTEFKGHAFYGCTALTSVIFEGNAPSFGSNSFTGTELAVNYPACGSGWAELAAEGYEGVISWEAYEHVGEGETCELCGETVNSVPEAGGESCGENARYTISDDGVLTISGTGAIDDHAFANNASIAFVVIEEGITGIGAYAFENCTGLVSVDVAASVGSVCDGVFSGCVNLAEINFNGSAPSFGEVVFDNVTATINIRTCLDPEGWYLPTEIYGDVAWNNLGHLPNEENVCVYCGTAVESSDEIGGSCGENARYTISDDGVLTINGTGAISAWAFAANTEIISVVIEEGITSIGEYAFYDCIQMTNVTMADTVESVDAYAFGNCTSLEAVAIGEGVTVISESAFSSCFTLRSIAIPDAVTTIGAYAFAYCSNLNSVTLGNSVTTIGTYAFGSCRALTSIDIPASVTSIDEYAFQGCYQLKNFNFKGDAPAIDSTAFDGNYYTNVNYPVCADGWDAAKNAGYTININWKGSHVGDGELCELCGEQFRFSGTCGEGVTWVLEDGKLVISGTGEIAADSFKDNTDTVNVVIENGVTAIGDSAFSGCTNITNITIPNSVTVIGDSAFYDCTGLTYLSINNSIKVLGDSAFMGCTSLREIYIGEEAQLSDIGSNAFRDCTALTYIELPETVITVGADVFSGCTSMVLITFRGNAPEIHEDAFGDIAVHVRYPLCGTGWEAVTAKDFGDNLKWADTEYVKHVIGQSDICSLCGEETDISKWGRLGDEGNMFWTTINGDTIFIGGVGVITWGPWGAVGIGDDYAVDIKKVIIDDGVTGIGSTEYMSEIFVSLSAVESVVISDTVQYIGQYAFFGMDSLESVTIPGNVKVICEDAFQSCYALKTVVIEEGVEEMRRGVFMHCTGLESVTIPGSISVIPTDAFAMNSIYKSALKEVNIAEGVTEIGSNAFYMTGIEEIKLPESLVTIGPGAFAASVSLKEIYIPANVSSIGVAAFAECSGLTKITVDENNAYFMSTEDGVLLTKDGTELVAVPGGMSGDYTIPDGVTKIRNYAFFGCDYLGNVYVPESVTEVGEAAFASCDSLEGIWTAENSTSFKSSESGELYSKDGTVIVAVPASRTGEFTVPEGVTVIGAGAFRDCEKLENIILPESLTSIKTCAFGGSGIGNMSIPKNVTEIGELAFLGCTKLENITIKGICSIGDLAFANTGLAALTFESDAPTVANGITLSYVNLINYPECADGWNDFIMWGEGNGVAVSWIPYSHVWENDVCTVCGETTEGGIADSGTCGEDLTWTLDTSGVLTISGTGVIDGFTFANNSDVVSVVIEDGVTGIGESVFASCQRMTSVSIPASVTTIGEFAFENCGMLPEITIPGSVTNIPVGAFLNCKNLKKIEIEEDVETIGDNAFQGCTVLKEISFPSTLTSIGSSAFYNCSSLTSVVIPGNVLTVYDYAFYGCYRLKSVVLESGVQSIGSRVFCECSNLTTVELSDTLTSIGDYAFGWCRNLETIEIPGSVTTMGEHIFQTCESLKNVTIGEGVTALGYGMFMWCSAIKSVELPMSITAVSDSVFWGCSSLEDVVFKGNAPTMANWAFESMYEINLNVSYSSCATGWDTVAGSNYGATSVTWTTYDHVGEKPECELCGENLVVMGSINADGTIDALDANLIYAFFNEISGVKLTERQMAAADVNGDGDVDALDANLIYSYFNEVITAFPNAG